MKLKFCNLLIALGGLCINQNQALGFSFALDRTIYPTDTVKRTLDIYVKDAKSSKLLDSVLVKVGSESVYTKNGLAKFVNTPDSIIYITRPGYSRLVTKSTKNKVNLSIFKIEESYNTYVTNPDLGSKEVNSSSAVIRSVSGDEIRRVTTLSLFDGLKTYVPSLAVVRNPAHGDNPNVLSNTQLRGVSSFPYTNVGSNKNYRSGLQVNPSQGDYRASRIVNSGTPTYLLDGVEVSAQVIQDMDLNRVESIDVLEDAMATSVYGMTGGNGVIAIKTIKPKSKFQLSFVEQFNITTANLSSFKPLNAKQKLDIDKNSGFYDGNLEQIYLDRLTKNADVDWLAIPLRTGLGSKHSLLFSAGNDDISYGLNAGYSDSEGVMKGSNRQTIDLGAYFGGRIGRVVFNNQFTFLNTNAANSVYGSFDSYLNMNPYLDPIDPITGGFQKFMEAYEIGSYKSSIKNPAFNSTLATLDKNKYSRFSNLTNINYIIGHGLTINGMINVASQSDQIDYFLPPSHTTFADLTAENLFKRGLYQYTGNSFFDLQGGIQLQYAKRFDKHQINAFLGQRAIQTSSNSEYIEVTGFAVDRLADISFGNAYSVRKPVTGKIKTRYASTSAGFGYVYDDRYQIDGSYALDYYSGINAASHYYAGGLSWNIHNESFLKDVDWINKLRVKGSLGTSGNMDFLAYLNRTTYLYYTDQQYIPANGDIGWIGIGLGAYLTGYGNPTLLAPKTTKKDVSISGTVLNNKLSFHFNAFEQNHENMVLPNPINSYNGFKDYSYYSNYGGIKSKGFEAGIHANVIDNTSSAVKLNVMANIYHAKDKITSSGSFLEEMNAYYDSNLVSQKTSQAKYEIGYSPYSIWAVQSYGIDAQTGEELFVKKDGTITSVWDANDKIYAGNQQPEWVGNFGFDVAYKNFSFASYFNFYYGAKIYNQTMANIENADVHQNLDGRVFDTGRWTPGMSDAKYKSLFHSPTYATTRLVESNNRLQCSSISLGYELPKSVVERFKAKNVGLRVVANNLFDVGGPDMQWGTNYPFQRSFSFILKATF